MTREEARKAAEVMLAYADGKEVEFYEYDADNKWNVDHSPVFDWSNLEYRIKKEPTYRPFKDKEECWVEMQKHQPFGWLKHKQDGDFICLFGVGYDTDFVDINTHNTFADGAPFGIREE